MTKMQSNVLWGLLLVAIGIADLLGLTSTGGVIGRSAIRLVIYGIGPLVLGLGVVTYALIVGSRKPADRDGTDR